MSPTLPLNATLWQLLSSLDLAAALAEAGHPVPRHTRCNLLPSCRPLQTVHSAGDGRLLVHAVALEPYRHLVFVRLCVRARAKEIERDRITDEAHVMHSCVGMDVCVRVCVRTHATHIRTKHAHVY